MRLVFFRNSFGGIVAFIILSQTESFASKSPSLSYVLNNEKISNQYFDISTSPFLKVPRGGFASSKVMKPKSNLSSLHMTAATGVSGGGSESVGGGTATIPNEIFNLVKNIVGAGVLSLPAGVLCLQSCHSYFFIFLEFDYVSNIRACIIIFNMVISCH